jgi:hypothetical protein
MSDGNRDRETVRETDRTTVIDTGGRGGGSGGAVAIVAIILLLGIAAIFFFVFNGGQKAADKVGVNVTLPQVDTPDINLSIPDKIDVNVPKGVKLPDVEVKGGEASSNASK